jgi:hypothetical protein
MIIEGIVSTERPDGSPHLAPLGPVVDRQQQHWLLRPFQGSATYTHLRDQGRCVFHIVDDPWLLVQTLLGQTPANVCRYEAEHGHLLRDCCQWFALQVVSWDISQPRTEAVCRMVASGDGHRFWGWNRAAHALIELAIVISRLHLLEPSHVRKLFESHLSAIEKTGEAREREAYRSLCQRAEQWLAEQGDSEPLPRLSELADWPVPPAASQPAAEAVTMAVAPTTAGPNAPRGGRTSGESQPTERRS